MVQRHVGVSRAVSQQDKAQAVLQRRRSFGLGQVHRPVDPDLFHLGDGQQRTRERLGLVIAGPDDGGRLSREGAGDGREHAVV